MTTEQGLRAGLVFAGQDPWAKAEIIQKDKLQAEEQLKGIKNPIALTQWGKRLISLIYLSR